MIGENRTDELVIVTAAVTPSVYTIAAAASCFGFVAPRRTVSLQATYRI